MLVLSILVFLTVACTIAGAILWMTPTRTEQRLQAATTAGAAAQWTERVVKLAGPFARLSTPSGDWEDSPLRLRFMHAGFRRPSARLVYFATKTLLPVTLALLAFSGLRAVNQTNGLVLLFYVMLSALAGCYLPNILLAMRVRHRQREIFENFPDAADLMLVCMEAGLGLDASLGRVADEMRRKCRALAEELHLTILEMRAGGTREKSLRNLALRTGVEEVTTFATMLTQADRFGTSIGDSLRVFSEDLRHKRRIRAEERAAKVPTKMLFPLVICIFPAINMVILGPAIIQLVRTLLPMINGNG
jgi:tight adherence protein C